ncbi:hypothetical protein GL286_22110 [Paracoccus aestuariivivens]|uniref:Uncharacterized protein n=1 Tax=Paracoccus aestuariivivens TaxID=1820333 RepID=A0A6L6JE24_9RHOB|nr:hypothetical protein [Paracoccus aestuariivivens]
MAVVRVQNQKIEAEANGAVGISGFSARTQHDAASEGKTMTKRSRRYLSPAFKAKVAIAETKGEKTMIESALFRPYTI